MIIDMLSNMYRYRAIHQLFPVVTEFIAGHELSAIEVGKYDITRGITLSINEYATKPPAEKRAEYHLKYIDIQVMLSGTEMVGYCCRTEAKMSTSFDTEKDVGFVVGEYDFLKLRSGYFTVFFSDDVHMPGVHNNEIAGTVRKAVFKVPA